MPYRGQASVGDKPHRRKAGSTQPWSLRLRRGAGAGGAGGAGWRTLAEKGYYIPRLPPSPAQEALNSRPTGTACEAATGPEGGRLWRLPARPAGP